MSVHQAHPKSRGNTRQFQRICFVSLVFLVILLASSGCSGLLEKSVDVTVIEIPDDLSSASLDFSTDYRNIGTRILTDAYILADKFGDAQSKKEIEDIARDYYADNMWAEKVIYYDAVTGEFIDLPYSGNKVTLDYIPLVTEADLDAVDGILHLDCVYVAESGYLDLIYTAVYDNAGVYKGYLILAYDMGVVLTEHPVVEKKAHSYDNLICYIVNADNKIIYSSKPEYIGETIPADKPYVTTQSVLSPQETALGAYTYKSRAFDYYDRSVMTDKITSWQKFVSFKNPYVAYLTKEVDSPELNYGEILTPEIEPMERNVYDLYVYAKKNGKQAAADRVNSDYYSTAMYVVDMDGTIRGCSSTEKNWVGLNFLNFRDTYGVSFMEQMIFAAQQGSGYVYYLYPVDGTLAPRASLPYVGHVILAGDDWFVMGTSFAETKISPINYQIREDVTMVARAAAKMAYEYGTSTLTGYIKSNVGKDGSMFVPGVTTSVPNVGVYDYDGYLYASLNPRERWDMYHTAYTDIYGGSTVRRSIMLAKSGGGTMTNLVAHPGSDGVIDWWIYVIEPINNNYFVYAETSIGEYTDYLTPFLKR